MATATKSRSRSTPTRRTKRTVDPVGDFLASLPPVPPATWPKLLVRIEGGKEPRIIELPDPREAFCRIWNARNQEFCGDGERAVPVDRPAGE